MTPGRTIQSIFFGGGTPSLMPPEAVAHVLDAIAGLWNVSPQVEITLEANPGTAEADRFLGYREAGVNRLSLGIQSFDDAKLKALGRIHGGDEARRAGAGRYGAGVAVGEAVGVAVEPADAGVEAGVPGVSAPR